MTEEQKEKYANFLDKVSEILGLNKPVDVLKLCAVTDEYLKPIEKRIAELEKENAELKAGRPEWHKVADGDLPKEESHYWSKIVLFQTNKGDSYVGFFDYANKAWYEKSTDYVIFGVMAWCEIPKYTEE